MHASFDTLFVASPAMRLLRPHPHYVIRRNSYHIDSTKIKTLALHYIVTFFTVVIIYVLYSRCKIARELLITRGKESPQVLPWVTKKFSPASADVTLDYWITPNSISRECTSKK